MSGFRDELGSPSSYIELTEGRHVLSSEGERVGVVEEIRADPNADVFDSVIVAMGPLGTDRRLVVAAQVDEIYERGVVLTLDADGARELPAAG